MKDKIIFWIDAFPLSFFLSYYFGKQYDCELYAIMDITDQPKKFYQKQKLVNFKKVWFYHDHITIKKPDLNYLKSFEEKYKINLWTLAYNERIFYQYNEFYKFSLDEVLSILEHECRLFENILDEVKPNFVFMYNTTLHHNHLFYEICKARKIKTLFLVSTRLGTKYAISSTADIIDFKDNLIQTYKKRTFEELQNYLKENSFFKVGREFEQNFIKSKSGAIRAVLRFLFTKNSNLKTHYSYFGRTKIKVLIIYIRNYLKKTYRKSFIEKNFAKKIDMNEPYILYTMQQEPERSLLITAPFYTNELEVLKNIVKSLPVGYKLYVKEHHAMDLRDWRKISYYKEILNLPNVKLLHPYLNPEEIIKNSLLVIAISGTSAFEAAFYNKPSIVFAETSFSNLPSVYKIKSLDELPTVIRNLLKMKVNSDDISRFIDIIEKNSFNFNVNSIIIDYQNRFTYGGFLVDVKIKPLEMEKFLEFHKEKFNKLVSVVLKKIAPDN